MLKLALVFFLSYLIGSIPTGLIIGKSFWQVDLRKCGSFNIGATNAWRSIGKKAGLSIFFADFLKGVFAVFLGAYFLGTPTLMLLSGMFAIVGHSLSIFLHFQGGKGVATGLGVIACLMPKLTLFVFFVWLLIVYLTGYVSLASLVSAFLVPILAFFFSYPFSYLLATFLIALFITYRHRTNIKRLLHGTENKIKARK